MTCGGCSKAVTRIMSKMEGITFEVILEEKKLLVTTDDPEAVTTKLTKWAAASGKAVEFKGKTA